MSITCRRFASAALTLGLLATPLAASGQTTRYRVVRLSEIITTQTSCVPTAVNANGDVIGFCGAGADDAVAVLWRNGAVTELGRLPRGTFSHAYGINAAGQVVGDGNDNDPRNKAVIFGSNGALQIDGSGGSFQSAYGITDDGRIFGNFSTVGSPGLSTWEPVFWTFDAAHDRYDRNDLPRPTGTPTGFSGAFVFGASNAGIAVGQATSDIVGVRAALWQNDATHTLVLLENPLGGAAGAAFGVSAAGHVAGMSSGATQPERGVVWLNDAAHSPIVLVPLPGDLSSRAFAVNTAGIVVGASFAPGAPGRGFVFRDGSSRELTNLLDADSSGWTINEPAGINDAGQIVATATLDGARHPVLLAPFTPGPIESVTLGANVASPQQTGTSITFTAVATGGATPYEFRFRITDGVTTTTVQDWSAPATFTWTPATANPNYQIFVDARSDGSTAEAGEQTAMLAFPIFSLVDSVTLAANLSSPQTAGASIIFTAAATGGTAPYEFKWFVDDGASLAMVQDWGPAAAFTWSPTAANADYAIVVWVRGAGATTDVAEQSASLPFVITRDVVVAVSITADQPSPQIAGTSITFTAAVTGGTAPYEFKWLVSDGVSTVVANDWSASANFTWTPATANPDYRITVWVRGAGNTTDAAEQSATANFAIVSEPVTTPHDNRDGDKRLPGERRGKGAPEFDRGHGKDHDATAESKPGDESSDAMKG
jgi:uncharacterized membrane protein